MAPQVHDASEVRLVSDVRTNLGESPSWDGQSARLLSVDINGKKIFVLDPDTQQHETISLPEMIGAVMPTMQPNVLLAAVERDVVLIEYSDPSSPQIRVVASTPESHGLPADGWRFNDAKVSPGGTLIAGRMHKAWRDCNPGRMYSLAPGGQLQPIMQSDTIGLPNGMAWDTQKRVMYFADTAANAVFSYPTDADGVPNVNSRQTAFKTDAPPDGITISDDGNVWVALVETGSVACYSPSSGEQLHVVKLPVQRPTALTFGGTDLDTLFVTTRAETGPDASQHAGGVFSIRIPGIKGIAAAYTFKI